MMEAEIINLDDFEHFGEGAAGQSFNKKDDDNVILKLINPNTPIEFIVNELESSQKAYSIGISTPKPGKLVLDPASGRYGVLYERIKNKISYSRAIANKPEQVETYARKFADTCKKLHSIHLPEGFVPDEKLKDLELLKQNPFFTPAEKEKLEKFIIDAPCADTAIHGDLNFGNVIMSEGRDWFIDLGEFSCGHPLFDLGMVYFSSRVSSEEFMNEYYHMGRKLAAEFWRHFVYGYWGDDADQKEIEELIRPYAGLKLLLIERLFPVRDPVFHALLDSVTG